MDKMLEAIQADGTEDPPTAEVEVFFKPLEASEEPLCNILCFRNPNQSH
jgi:hypothetical protein